MNESQPSVKISKWPFYIGSLSLIAIAILIAFLNAGQLSAGHFFWCVASVLMGSILLVYPFWQEFKLQKTIQALRPELLSKAFTEHLEQTHKQNKEFKDLLLQSTQKQQISQNLTSTTLQNIDNRFAQIVESVNLKHTPDPSLRNEIEILHSSIKRMSDDIALVLLKFQFGIENKSPLSYTPPPLNENPSTPLFFSPENYSRTSTPPPVIEPSVDDIFALFTEEISLSNNACAPSYPPPLKCEDSFLPSPETSPLADISLQDTVDISLESPPLYPFPKKAQGTSLTVNAFLGIGKKPYIRGQGPGLSWNRGTSMEFLEAGKWQWSASDSSQPIICRIYKNDEVPAEGEVICLQPGEEIEVSPSFKS